MIYFIKRHYSRHVLPNIIIDNIFYWKLICLDVTSLQDNESGDYELIMRIYYGKNLNEPLQSE